MKVTLCLRPTFGTHCHCPGMGKNLCRSRFTSNRNLQSSLSQPNITLIRMSWHIILSIGLSASLVPSVWIKLEYPLKIFKLYDSRNSVCHLCFGVSLVFPKILTSLNVNHPIGIHVTNASDFPSMCGLCFCSDLSLARKK